MDRKTILALLLVTSIFMVWNIINMPSEEELAEQRRIKKEKIEKNEIEEKSKTPKTEFKENNVLDTIKKLKPQISVLENKELKIKFSNIGAEISEVSIKNYKKSNGDSLKIIDDNYHTSYTIPILNKIFVSSQNQFNIKEQSKNKIIYEYLFDSTKKIRILYEVLDKFQIKKKIEFINLNYLMSRNQSYAEYNIDYDPILQEHDLEAERNRATIYYKPIEEDVDDLGIRTEENEENIISRLKWVSFSQQFFSVIVKPDTHFNKPTKLSFKTPTEDLDKIKNMSFFSKISIDREKSSSFSETIYFGPNKFSELKKLGNSEKDIMDLGWAIIRPVSEYLIVPLFNFLSRFDLNMGLLILLLTIIIKTVLFPLSYKSFLSMAKMKVLRPQIEEIQSKFKKDEALKSQQAMMAFYKKAGVSPFGGCLPQLLQFPILVSLFYFFPTSIELRQQGFLWADDLSTFDSIATLPFTIPFYGNHVSLFTLLMAASSFFYMKINGSGGTPTGGNNMMAQQMKVMQYIFPFMMIMWFNSYSAGLSYYYFLTNVISLLQHFIIKKFIIDEKKLLNKIEIRKASYKAKPKSKFQKRLEEMAKQRAK